MAGNICIEFFSFIQLMEMKLKHVSNAHEEKREIQPIPSYSTSATTNTHTHAQCTCQRMHAFGLHDLYSISSKPSGMM